MPDTADKPGGDVTSDRDARAPDDKQAGHGHIPVTPEDYPDTQRARLDVEDRGRSETR